MTDPRAIQADTTDATDQTDTTNQDDTTDTRQEPVGDSVPLLAQLFDSLTCSLVKVSNRLDGEYTSLKHFCVQSSGEKCLMILSSSHMIPPTSHMTHQRYSVLPTALSHVTMTLSLVLQCP